MNLLLDTHVLLWWLAKSRRLSRTAEDAILNCARAYVSAATAWEIRIKSAMGKLEFRGEPLAAINISAPTSRWTLSEMRSKLAPLLLQTARAASLGHAPRLHRR